MLGVTVEASIITYTFCFCRVPDYTFSMIYPPKTLFSIAETPTLKRFGLGFRVEGKVASKERSGNFQSGLRLLILVLLDGSGALNSRECRRRKN